MRFAAVLAAVSVLLLAPPLSAKPKPRKNAPPQAKIEASRVTIARASQGWSADLAFDGRLLGWALPRTGSGHRELLALVGPKPEVPAADAAPCGARGDRDGGRDARLFRWRAGVPDALELLASGLPEGGLEAADLDGDGMDELLLQRDGAVDLVAIAQDGKAAVRALVVDAAIAASCCAPRVAWDGLAAGGDALRLGTLGVFRTYRRTPAGAVAIASELDIPARVRPGPDGVRVESLRVRSIGLAASGRRVFATDPETLGKTRLRTILLDPDGPPETRRLESWALFPGAERVMDRSFVMLDGAPALVVTTISADKLRLLGEKALRVYPLSPDRTRAGNASAFAATTGINLWQTAVPTVIDLDRDGRDDLVLAYWKGLKNAIAALEVYRGSTASGFSAARTMSFDVENGDKGFMEFGQDVDGDGRPDLVLLAGKEILVFPGAPVERAEAKPVSSTPSLHIPLPENLPRASGPSVEFGADDLEIVPSDRGLGTPHILDADGDGRPEALFAGDGGGGGRLVVVFFSASQAPAGP